MSQAAPRKTSSTARKRKGKIKIKQKAAIVRKDSIQRDSVRNDTFRKAPFIMNDNGLNMRIKIKRKSR